MITSVFKKYKEDNVDGNDKLMKMIGVYVTEVARTGRYRAMLPFFFFFF